MSNCMFDLLSISQNLTTTDLLLHSLPKCNLVPHILHTTVTFILDKPIHVIHFFSTFFRVKDSLVWGGQGKMSR